MKNCCYYPGHTAEKFALDVDFSERYTMDSQQKNHQNAPKPLTFSISYKEKIEHKKSIIKSVTLYVHVEAWEECLTFVSLVSSWVVNLEAASLPLVDGWYFRIWSYSDEKNGSNETPSSPDQLQGPS